jgi:hypothetical protein
LVSFELARLSTRTFATSPRYGLPQWQAVSGGYVISDYHATARRLGHLPQGAPTSPVLSNLALSGLDEELNSLAEATK